MHSDHTEGQVVGGIYGFYALRRILGSVDIYMGYIPKLHCHLKARNYESFLFLVGRCLFVIMEQNC